MPDEFPIPFQAFARTLVKTPEEVWTKLLKMRHGKEKHTPTEWRALINAARNEPVG